MPMCSRLYSATSFLCTRPPGTGRGITTRITRIGRSSNIKNSSSFSSCSYFTSSGFLSQQPSVIHLQKRTFFIQHSNSGVPVLYSKFTVGGDPHTIPSGIGATDPLDEQRAYELLLALKEVEVECVKKAIERYEAKKIKEGFEGKLAATRWRSRFGRPARLPKLGEVDPTGSYCAVPPDWLRKKSVEKAKPPASSDLWKIFMVNAVPFIGFGFLDNFTMIIAGDYIESIFGAFMCISTMAAAGLGNTISDILGIGSAYYVERLCEMLGLRPPDLTPIQLEMKSSRRSANIGRIFGITLGCIIGMIPLLFMDMKHPKQEEPKIKENPKEGTKT